MESEKHSMEEKTSTMAPIPALHQTASDGLSINEGVVIAHDNTSGSKMEEGGGSGDEEGPMKKDLGLIGILAAGFNVSNSWLVIAATLVISIEYGPMNTVWGVICVTPIYLCIGLTLAELISVYPTAGGQYHWTSILAPSRIKNILSYFCGFCSWFSWLCMASSSNGATVLCVYALIMNSNADFVPKPWISFLIFQCTNTLAFVFNLFGKRIIESFYTLGFIFSLAAFFAFTITGLIMQKDKQSSTVVWTSYTEESGWSPGIQFLIALSAPIVAFCPLDGAVHLVEEVRDARRAVPRTIMAALVISFITSLAFALSAVYSISDFDAVIETPSGFVLFEIWIQATAKQSIAVVYTVVTLALLPIGSIACVQVASMMTWSLGRDGGLPFGSFLSRINQTLNAPVWALIWNYVVMFLIGILYLISSLAYNSIIGVSVILQQVVLVIPVSLVLYHRRSEAILPKDRAFYLPDWLGWTVNIVTFIFTVVIPVFLLFPTVNPPDQATMNYAVAVFGGVVLMSLANWVVYAMRHYNGPSTIKFHN